MTVSSPTKDMEVVTLARFALPSRADYMGERSGLHRSSINGNTADNLAVPPEEWEPEVLVTRSDLFRHHIRLAIIAFQVLVSLGVVHKPFGLRVKTHATA